MNYTGNIKVVPNYIIMEFDGDIERPLENFVEIEGIKYTINRWIYDRSQRLTKVIVTLPKNIIELGSEEDDKHE